MKKIIFALIILSAACSKDENDEPKPSRAELLTSTAWELVSIDGEDPDLRITFTFNPDGKLDYETQLTAGNGQWSLLNEDKTLHISFNNGGTYNYTIVTFTASELVYTDAEGKENVLHPSL